MYNFLFASFGRVIWTMNRKRLLSVPVDINLDFCENLSILSALPSSSIVNISFDCIMFIRNLKWRATLTRKELKSLWTRCSFQLSDTNILLPLLKNKEVLKWTQHEVSTISSILRITNKRVLYEATNFLEFFRWRNDGFKSFLRYTDYYVCKDTNGSFSESWIDQQRKSKSIWQDYDECTERTTLFIIYE